MTIDYQHVDTKVLGQMMQIAKQQDVPSDLLTGLTQAFAQRKGQLEMQLAALKYKAHTAKEIEENSRLELNVLTQLIALEPDEHTHYYKAGRCCLMLDDYAACVAYYTTALQVVPNNPDHIWRIYQERGRAFFRWGKFPQALDDNKTALRYKYLATELDDIVKKEKRYGTMLWMIRESLKHLGNDLLANQLGTTYEYEVEYEEYVEKAGKLVSEKRKEIEQNTIYPPIDVCFRLLQLEV